MLAPFQFSDGAAVAPGATWTNEPTTGFYRKALGDLRVAILGDDLFQWSGGVASVWNSGLSQWDAVLTTASTGILPEGTADGQTLVWVTDAWVPQVLDSLNVSYDPTGNTYITALTVQGALGEVDAVFVALTLDIAGVQTNLDAHAGDGTIHWDDVPTDGLHYTRSDQAWVATAIFDEAPVDGTAYSRQDAAWVATSAFVDAPVDGKTYGRKDGAWVEIVATSSIPDGTVDGQCLRWNDGAGEWQPASTIIIGASSIDVAGQVRATGNILSEANVSAYAT